MPCDSVVFELDHLGSSSPWTAHACRRNYAAALESWILVRESTVGDGHCLKICATQFVRRGHESHPLERQSLLRRRELICRRRMNNLLRWKPQVGRARRELQSRNKQLGVIFLDIISKPQVALKCVRCISERSEERRVG